MSENKRPIQPKTTSQRPRPAAQGTRTASQAQRSRAAAAKRRKKQQQQKQLMTLLIAAVAILIVVLLLVVINPFGKKPAGNNTPTAPVSTQSTSDGSGIFTDVGLNSDNYDGLNASEAGSINVSDLSITPGLDESWENILLLGIDGRVLTETSRSDTMMICSINRNTGAIKLTSLMRDSEVKIEGKNRRLNTAYFFGGPKLAMRTVNECFGMNISKYVVVNFASFAEIAEKVGGVEIDVTKNEVEEINASVQEQYWLLYKQGKMTYDDAKNAYLADILEAGGANTHLNGMQTLGYARIRKLDSDYGRAERQRRVLNLLMVKLKGKSTVDLMNLAMGSMGIMRTNLDMNTIMTLGQKVLARDGFNGAETFVLPVRGTYREDKRGEDDDAMLWNIDFDTNKRELHAFIYLR